MLCPPQCTLEPQVSQAHRHRALHTASLSLQSQEHTHSDHLLCHGHGPCPGRGLGPGRSLARPLSRSSRWRSRRGPASCARACCRGASLQHTEGEAGGVLGHNSTSLEQAHCTPSPLNAGKLLPGQRGLLCPMVRPGAGPQPEPPPLSSLRLLEGCLCCSFCRLFREAVLSLGTSDFMSICKGTHLCLLPAKGQGLGVTQVQRASASCPAAPSCHAAPTHGGEKAAGPFGQTLSSDIPPGLAGHRKALTRTLRHGGT